jgi:UDPglucose 6-dehydrogenase
MHKIAVAGTGYVGLSLSVLLSQKNEVRCLDIIKEKVDMINNKRSPIVDKEIEYYLLHKNLNIIATTDEKFAYSDAEIVIIATPTNYNETTNKFDTSSVDYVIKKVTELNPKALIVIKSTIPVGFTLEARKRFKNDNIIFSPEFLREGKALYDNLYPSRIVAGCDISKQEDKDKALLFTNILKECAEKTDVQILVTSLTEAEAIKLFANTYLATRVSFFNELDTYCLEKGLDSASIIEGIGLDPRIGLQYNNPSFGYGGYCLPKDTKQLLSNYEGVPQAMISAVVESNKIRKNFISKKILQLALKQTKKPVIGIFRLTMKFGSDNFRQSAIQDIINQLVSMNCKVIVYEPTINTSNVKIGNNVIDVNNDINDFASLSTIIVSNRNDEALRPYCSKLFTRDIYNRD